MVGCGLGAMHEGRMRGRGRGPRGQLLRLAVCRSRPAAAVAPGHEGGRSVTPALVCQRRLVVQVCKFFMEHARCKFGKNCRYNHPNIAYMHGPLAGSTVTTIPPPTPLPPALRQKKGQA